MRVRITAAFVLIAMFVAPAATVHADKPAAPPYVVIVNSSNATTKASRKFVSDAFLKKTTRWPNGDVIKPADQGPDSAVRKRFTEDVHNRSVAAVQSYWQQIVFSGRDLPPPELGTNEEVVKFVSSHAGAIGYVEGSTSVTDVRVLGVE